ncbi:MAG: prepilin-type N-terminal cleavage/methylation domain-containing protein [Pseudomonadota bacterium]|jgi:type II secretion system protein J
MLKRPSSAETGFTLIEVMTAVTILAILGAVAFTIVFGAVKRSRHIDARIQLNTEAAAIVSLISEDLRGAYVREGVVPYFQGSSRYSEDNPIDDLSLLTTAILPVSPEIPAGGVGEVQYYFTEGDNDANLLMRREQIPARAPYDSGGEDIEISDRVRSLDLTFSDGEDWFEKWDTESTLDHEAGVLPKQVRIVLELEEGDLTVTYRGSVAPVMAVGR